MANQPRQGGRQSAANGKEGVVCRLDIDTGAAAIGGYKPAKLIRLRSRDTGFKIDRDWIWGPSERLPFVK